MTPSSRALALLLVACTPGPERGPDTSPAPTGKDLEWRTLAPAPSERTEVTAATDGRRILVVGGFDESGATVATVEIYDTRTDEWSAGPDLPVAVNHPMSASLRGDVYVFGGYLGPSLSNPSDRAFVLRDDTWEELPSMPEPRAAAGAAAAGGKLHVVGGVGPAGLADRSLVFALSTETWSVDPGLPTPREHLGVAGADGRIFAVGGRTGGIGSNLTAAEAFDPDTGDWEELPRMPTARGGIAAAATINGFVVAPGGEAEATFDQAEALDVRAERWISLPPMPTARHGLGVAAVGTVVYVIAGGPTPGLDVSNTAEAIDLAPLR